MKKKNMKIQNDTKLGMKTTICTYVSEISARGSWN